MAKRILIADDSVTIQKAFAMTFAGEDVAVTTARSADEAFALAQKVRPDLIIADGVMPGRTGYDLCAQVRSDPGLRGIPFYILASAQQPYDEARATKSGADGNLTKPWDTAAFLQQVATLGPGAAAPARRTTASSMPLAAVDDAEYGEISIDGSGEPATPPPVVTAPAPAAAPMPRSPTPPLPAAPLATPPGMRPSLIPGMRPGVAPGARPGTAPVRPLAPGAGTQAPPRPAAPAAGRTMIGLPVAGIPMPGMARAAGPGAAPMPAAGPALRAPFAPAPPPAATPVVPFSSPSPPPRPRTMTPTPPPVVAPPPRARVLTPSPATTPPPTAHPPASSLHGVATPSAVSQSIEQKLAAISAKGPEYEAIAKLSREIIEQVVWEVVPDLAEAIIREHMEKRGRLS
ncbi:MAG TPA: response regulator [Polyangia bacterium]|nr:response regulator [Polyangia bacterium]